MGLIDRQAGPFDKPRTATVLALPPLAWILFEYGADWAMRGSCRTVGAWLGPAWGIVSLLACALAFVLARPMARRGAGGDPPARPWLARTGLLGAGVFGLAIFLQTLATLIVPPCTR